MKTATLVFLLQIASILHVGLVCAGASMPRAVGLKERLAILPPFIRRLFFVYFMFIGLVLIGFGTLTFCFAGAMVEGEPLARALCGLMLAFWILRLVAAAFIFDVRPYLTNWFYRAGYQATNAVFVYLVLIYLLTIWKGGKLM